MEQCAPTLAGIKPASLFRWGSELGAVRRAVRYWAAELAPFGIELQLLKECPRTGSGLIYVFRRDWLTCSLTEPAVGRFLCDLGYSASEGCDGMLRQLARRLSTAGTFPHEIGLFLGYPLKDVEGFIENRGKNYSLCGCWKVYGDPEEAKTLFTRYRSCTDCYRELSRRGVPVQQLVAAQ